MSILSIRERAVLDLMCAGRTNREIAAQLYLSPHTVKDHTSALYRKLKARNRAEAVQRAHELFGESATFDDEAIERAAISLYGRLRGVPTTLVREQWFRETPTAKAGFRGLAQSVVVALLDRRDAPVSRRAA